MEKIVFGLAERVRRLDQLIHPLMLKNRTFPVVNQLYGLFAAMQDCEYAEQLDRSKDKLVDEVVLSIGVDAESVESILAVLLDFELLVTQDGQIDMPNLHDFGLFADYCRFQLEVKGGIKNIARIEISPEMHSYFRQVLRELRQLRMIGCTRDTASVDGDNAG